MTRDLIDQAAAAAFCFAPRWIDRKFFDSIGPRSRWIETSVIADGLVVPI
jgi:hypothetical protein